jgi:hypothetical protein
MFAISIQILISNVSNYQTAAIEKESDAAAAVVVYVFWQVAFERNERTI